MLPMILGFAGLELTQDERDFFQTARPFGYILFQRNVESPQQLRCLTDELRRISGRDEVPILLDQEGGRVQKLRPPHWLDLPDMRSIGDLFAKNSFKGMLAAETLAQVIAGQLQECGINTVCAPIVDVPVHGAHDVIGNRAFSTDVDHVIPLAANVAKTLLRYGVTPIIKHVPGHGRADADSHYACPVVTVDKSILEKTDFKAFKNVAQQVGREKIWAMTAHVVFTAIDDRPASVSSKTMAMIRDELNITGPIIADTIEMNALGGSLSERGLAALQAGCDAFLMCSGKLEEAKILASVLPSMSEQSVSRFTAAQAPQETISAIGWESRYEHLKEIMGVDGFRPYRAQADITEALHQ